MTFLFLEEGGDLIPKVLMIFSRVESDKNRLQTNPNFPDLPRILFHMMQGGRFLPKPRNVE